MNTPLARRSLWTQLRHVRWRWVIPPGLAIPIVSAVAWVTLVFGYSALQRLLAPGMLPPTQLIERFRVQGAWVVPVITLALTFAAAAGVGRKVGARPVLHGVLIGTLAGGVGLILWTMRHGSAGWWGIVMVMLTVGVGWIGGMEAQSAVVGQAALNRASRAIAAARSPDAIVAALGEELGYEPVSRILLWQTAAASRDGTPTALSLLAAWPAGAAEAWGRERRLEVGSSSVVARMCREPSASFSAAALPAPERQVWEPLGVEAALLLPLVGPDATWAGVLMVLVPAACDLGRAVAGRFLAITSQTALALEHFQLIEQGRQIGTFAERQRLAREIHDSIKQQVFAAGMQIAAAQALMSRDPDAARARMAQADTLIQQVQAELTTVIQALRPVLLEGKGLAPVLHEYAADWSRQSDIPVDVSVRLGAEHLLALEAEQALFRIAQEALANIAKHSRATRATIELTCQQGSLQLSIHDDGRGFRAADEASAGYGLLSMRERIAMLGGQISVESVPGRGTRIVCTCPLAAER